MTAHRTILGVLPTVGHPRHAKRLDMLSAEYDRVHAVAFDRRSHRSRLPGCTVEVVGTIANRAYLRRVVAFVRVVPSVRRRIRQHDAVYAFGIDLALLALVAGIGVRRPVIVETGDLRDLEIGRGVGGRLVRWVERIVLARCALLVVTAPGYLDEHYWRIVRPELPVLVVENKVERGTPTTPTTRRHDGVLRIGYFGLLRCPWSWATLERLADVGGTRIHITVAGVSLLAGVPERATAYDNIDVVGPYRSPTDLGALYDGVDIVWAWNGRRAGGSSPARSNRFYEACYFSRPLIALRGADGDEVERHRIGLVFDGDHVDDVVERILRIDREQLERWAANLAQVPASVYTDTDESARLCAAIRAATGAAPVLDGASFAMPAPVLSEF